MIKRGENEVQVWYFIVTNVECNNIDECKCKIKQSVTWICKQVKEMTWLVSKMKNEISTSFVVLFVH